MRVGLDTSFVTTPFLSAIQATPFTDPVSGETGAAEYICRYLGKRRWGTLEQPEVDAIHAAGLGVVSILQRITSAQLESDGSRKAYYTEAQGRSDAAFAIAEARKLGQTAESPIYFTVDYDSCRDHAFVVSYFEGVNTAMRAVDSPFAVGAYGSTPILEVLIQKCLATYTWQCVSGAYVGNQDRWPYADMVQFAEGQKFPGTTLLVDFDCSPDKGKEGAW
jgi:hypothetical protein